MRERILGERRPMRKRRRTYIVAVALAALAAGLIFAMSAGGASLPGSNFEIDASANLKVDGAAPAIDWVSIPNTGVPNESRGQDTASGQNDSSYKGGEKEDDPCPTAGTGSIPNNKSDLKTFGAYVEPEAGGPGYLHLFWRRVNDPSGTTLMDFELNKNSADCDGAGPGINAARTQGDILLEYSIDQGGAQANVTARIWNGNATSGSWGPAGALPNQAIGEINDVAIPAAESDGLDTVALAPRTFGEMSLDLDFIFDEGSCDSFGSAMLKSRSSDAFNSALKDFIAPVPVNIQNCARVVIRKETNPASTQLFDFDKTFSTDPATANAFQLADNGVATYADVLFGNNLTVSEDTLPANWLFDSIDCAVAGHLSVGVTPVITPANRTVTFSLDNAADVLDCTFNNKQQLGAIKVTKSYKHAATPLDTTQEGVEFTVNGVKKNTNADGVACFDGLPFAQYAVLETLPEGYSADGDLSKNVTVDNNATCADATYVGESIGFGNTPLTDVTITVNSQVPGGTMSTVDCDVNALDAASDATSGDIASNTEEDLEPQTINCEIVIDP